MEQKLCYILGAGEYFGDETIRENAFIIACDGGLTQCERMRRVPDVIIGDFDSLGYEVQGKNVIKLPKIKDDTDTIAAVKYALAQGFRRFVLLGCTGGRLSHTVANLQTLTYLAKHEAIGFLVDKEEVATVVCKGMEFDKDCCGFLSVFAAEENVQVHETGLKYSARHLTLHADFPLGVSNEFCAAQAAVEVLEGTALLISDKKNWEDRI